ncbi:MAG: PHP domain-containing protein [Euryarchaeota archaeon]|nr:PHP domain-containing protein [Euryarchaeota archaeon]
MQGKADTHVHTMFSGFGRYRRIKYPESMTPPEEAVDAAIARKLDVLCVTDHNSIAGAARARKYALDGKKAIEVVVGEEVSTCDGEVVGLCLNEAIPAHISAAEAVERIRSQGGLAVAVHPYSFYCPSLGEKVKELPLDGMEVLNAAHFDGFVNRLALQHIPKGVAPLGGSDAHSTRMVGNAYTTFEGNTADDFFKAVRSCRTAPAGRTTTIWETINWTTDMAKGILGRMLTRDRRPIPGDPRKDPLEQTDRVRPHNRAIITFGAILYLLTPLPFIVGAMGSENIRRKGREAWKRHALKENSDIRRRP